jgi:hypothetical protein
MVHCRFVVAGRSRDGAGSVVRRSRWLLGVVAALIGASVFPGPARAGVVRDLGRATTVPAMDWKWEILVRLFPVFGVLDGDPGLLLLVDDTETRLQIVQAKYLTDGLPLDTTETEAAQARVDIEELNSLLLQAPPDVDSSVVSEFRHVLRSFYADVGGNPVDLDP